MLEIIVSPSIHRLNRQIVRYCDVMFGYWSEAWFPRWAFLPNVNNRIFHSVIVRLVLRKFYKKHKLGRKVDSHRTVQYRFESKKCDHQTDVWFQALGFYLAVWGWRKILLKRSFLSSNSAFQTWPGQESLGWNLRCAYGKQHSVSLALMITSRLVFAHGLLTP